MILCCCFLNNSFITAIIQGLAIIIAAYIGIDKYSRVKTRLFKIRTGMYDKFVQFQLAFNDSIDKGEITREIWENLLIPKLREVRPLFQIYGSKQERDGLENLIKSLENKDVNKFNEHLKILSEIVLKAIRKEYGIKD